MKFIILKFVLVVIAVLLLSSIAVAQGARGSRREQTTFAMETAIEKPVKVPTHVLQQIVRDDDLIDSNRRDEAMVELAERVQGSFVNLNNDGKSDLIVQGDDGANITGFWVFHNTGKRWELVLSTRAFGLSIDKTYTNGYRDISVSAMTAVMIFGTTYKYDLEKYQPRECWEQSFEENRKGRKGKITYLKCSEGSQKPYR